MKSWTLAAACAAAAWIGAAALQPAHAVPVEPNGSFTVLVGGPDTVDTGDISATTSSLTLSGSETIGSFQDLFLGADDNLCGAAGSGCLAAHSPGFLVAGDPVTQSASTFPVFSLGSGVHMFSDAVTACTGSSCVDFDFTSIFTSVLSPTTLTTSGTLTLDLLGSFASDTTGSYLLGQSASMSIACTQTTPGAAIGCVKTVSTPSTIATPEPASLTLLGGALLFLFWLRRLCKAA